MLLLQQDGEQTDGSMDSITRFFLSYLSGMLLILLSRLVRVYNEVWQRVVESHWCSKHANCQQRAVEAPSPLSQGRKGDVGGESCWAGLFA